MSDLLKWLTASGVTPFAVIGWIGVGIVAWMNIRWRIKNLESSHAAMIVNHHKLEDIIDKQVDITRDVELNNRELKIIALSTERRLQLVEDRMK